MSTVQTQAFDGMVLEPITQILKGDKGDAGGRGLQGLSAYQVWLAQGNTGTEADYIASLKGEKGDQGNSLNNRGTWVPGVYNPGDYVVSEGSLFPSALWFLIGDVPLNSTIQPKDAPAGRWSEAVVALDASVTSVNGEIGDIVLDAADVGAVPTTALGVSVATLTGGKIPNAQLPAIAITETYVVNTEEAQLALSAEEGDVAVRTDIGKSFIHTNSYTGTMMDWQELLSPTAPVQSVNGKTGAVTLTGADVGMVKATTAEAQEGIDDIAFMTPAKTLAEIIARTGWGGGTQEVTPDCNTVGAGRTYRTTGGTLNTPAGMAVDGVLINIRNTVDQVLQIWSTIREINATNRPCLFVRGYYGATQAWGPWRRMADDSAVLHPGDAGLGATSIQVSNNIASLNNATAAGFYRAAAGAVGNPTADGAFIAIHLPSGSTATFGAQFGVSESDGRVYTRLKSSGTWGSWIPYAFDSQVVHRTGDETIAGVKTFSSYSRWNLSTVGSVEYGTPAAFPGIIIRNGNPADDSLARRFDIRNAGTSCSMVLNNVDGNNTGSARGLTFELTAIRPSANNLLSLGTDSNAWTNVFTQALLVAKTTGDTAITVTSGSNAGAQAQCYFNTPQKNVIMQVSTSGRTGFWDATNSRWIWFSELAPGSIKFNGSLQPETTNAFSLGSASLLWTTVYATNATINTSDKRLKKNFRKITATEVAAFTEIQDLDWVWEWIENGDRLHAGPTVQDVEEIMFKHGLDPWAYSFMCYDKIEAIPEITVDVPEWTETVTDEVYNDETEETTQVNREIFHEAYTYVSQEAQPGVDRYGFRKEELNLWLTAANHARLKALEAKL